MSVPKCRLQFMRTSIYLNLNKSGIMERITQAGCVRNERVG